MASIDPDFSNVTLLLDFDGQVEGSTVIVDTSETPKTATVFGDAETTLTNPKFGDGSLVVDGGGGYITYPAADNLLSATGLFTIEMDLYPAMLTNWIMLFKTSALWTDTSGLSFGVGETQTLLKIANVEITRVDHGMVAGNYYHLAITRDASNLIRLFIGGIQMTSGTDASSILSSDYVFGYEGGAPSWYIFDGHRDNIRITDGVCRYTSNFTPPITAHPLGRYSLVGDTIVSLVNETIVSLLHKYYGLVGGSLITINNNSISYGFSVVVKPEIVGTTYVCTLTGAEDGTTDLTIPISNLSQDLNIDNTSSITVVCPNGSDFADEILARANGSIIIESTELYSDRTTQSSDSQEFGISAIQSSHGARNHSVSINGKRALTQRTPKKHTVRGHSFTSTNQQGRRTIRVGFDKDILPNDTIILTGGEEMRILTVVVIINSVQSFMSLTE